MARTKVIQAEGLLRDLECTSIIVSFACLLLQSGEAVRCEVLSDYIRRRTGRPAGSVHEMFRALVEILDGIRRGTGRRRLEQEVQDHRMIILD